MQLPARNRQDYVPIIKRNDYTWPGGKRLAVYFCNTLILRPVAYGEREPKPVDDTPDRNERRPACAQWASWFTGGPRSSKSSQWRRSMPAPVT